MVMPGAKIQSNTSDGLPAAGDLSQASPVPPADTAVDQSTGDPTDGASQNDASLPPIADGFWHHATSISGAIRIFFYIAGSLGFFGYSFFPLTATDAAISNKMLLVALGGIVATWLLSSLLISRVNDNLDAAEKRNAYWLDVFVKEKDTRDLKAPLNGKIHIIPWHALVGNQSKGLAQFSNIKHFLNERGGYNMNGVTLRFEGFALKNVRENLDFGPSNRSRADYLSNFDPNTTYPINGIKVSFTRQCPQLAGQSLTAEQSTDLPNPRDAADASSDENNDSNHSLKIKQFMNVVAIAAGFLYVQECFNFWSQSSPYIVFCFTLAVFSAIGYMWKKHKREQTHAPLTNRDIFVKVLAPCILASSVYLLPTFFPSMLHSMPAYVTYKALSFLFVFYMGYRTIKYKTDYENNLSALRTSSKQNFLTLNKNEGQPSPQHDAEFDGSVASAAELDDAPPSASTEATDNTVRFLKRSVYSVIQFVWEFLRTAFPLGFFLDFFVTMFKKNLSIGIVNMDFMNVLKHPPVAALVIELSIVAVFCSFFAYIMVRDGYEQDEHNKYIEKTLVSEPVHASRFPKPNIFAAPSSMQLAANDADDADDAGAAAADDAGAVTL